MADQGGKNNIVMRDYRKGNWTISETMVLIEAKKMDDERRMMMKRGSSAVGGGSGGDHNSEARPSSNKPAELRWKWVEDYCWRKGCLRSQNQCNDKWDNLMRDFKKVREYEKRMAERIGVDQGSNNEVVSYWNMEKSGRKEKNLPSNMMPQIYESLVEVVERKAASHQRMISSGSAPTTPTTPTTIGGYVVERPLTSSVQASLPPLLPHQVSTVPIPAAFPLPPPPPPPPPPPHEAHLQPPPPALPCCPTMCGSSDSDTSEYSDSPAKRRRRGGGNGNGGEGTSHGTGANATASTSSSHEVGSAISKSASLIAEALQACEEREERRHRDLICLHERRLKIEESKTEISRQGINGLVDAINKLASSILALASHNSQPPAPN